VSTSGAKIEDVTAELEPFEALAECSDAVVFVTDLTSRMLYASSHLERLTGFTADDFQFPQQADNPFIHREDADRVGQELAEFVAGDARVLARIENRFLDRWGRTFHCRSVVTKIKYRGTSALLFVVTPIQAPAASPEDGQYRALVESADDAIIRLDNAGRLLFANRSAHDLLGYNAVELGHMRLDDVVAPADRETFTAGLAQSLGAARPVRFEVRLVPKRGQEIRAQAALTSLTQFGYPGELLAMLRVGVRRNQ
jgi:PAS domain S-box-containing protein